MAKKQGVAVADFRTLADQFNMLGEETRLTIVFQLARQERNVGTLCKILKVNQPMMSYHLGLMKMVGLLLTRREGKEVIYSLNAEALRGLMGQLDSLARGKK